MRTSIFCFIFIAFFTPAFAQNIEWRAYGALFQGAKGIIEYDSSLTMIAPIAMQPFLISAVMQIQCNNEGLPIQGKEKEYWQFSDDVGLLLAENVKYTYAGAFVHNCVWIGYYYVSDTIGLRQQLVEMYKKKFPTHTLGLKIKQDKKWDTYLNFLFPGDKYSRTEGSVEFRHK